MKKIILYAAALLLSGGIFNACQTKGSGGEAESEMSYTVSPADSSMIVSETDGILTLMQSDDYAAAIERLYSFNPSDSTLTPLDEQERRDLEFRAKVFPVKTFSLNSVEFNNEMSNVVTYDVAFAAPTDDGDVPTTKMGFNVICKDGKFYPTLLEKR